MSDKNPEKRDEKPESGDWKRSSTGLWVPPGTPPNGKRPTVGFARALEEPK